MKKQTKTFTKAAVKQVAGAQLSTVTGGEVVVRGWDPEKRKEIVGSSGG